MILIIILVLLLCGGFGNYRGWYGEGPQNIVWILLVILLVLWLVGAVGDVGGYGFWHHSRVGY
jgi:Protein of unknown function (DUF3309)